MDSNIKVYYTNNTRNDYLLYPNSYISNSAYQNLESQEEHEQQQKLSHFCLLHRLSIN